MIVTDGPWFRDETGRILILRGVNLGGSSKVPSSPDGATHRRERFSDHRQVSFVGRPFPEAEADEHFARMRRWGFRVLRLLVTWEAIEHAGPGEYDLSFLEYFTAIVRKAGEHGLAVIIDPHQDVWSRFCGGDGAPGWTLEAAGFDITRFDETGAAILHQMDGDPFPKMIWPTNASKLAAATMFTLFFAGNDFAPRTHIDGAPAQLYLQRHYIDSVRQVAQRVSGQSHVIGYDTLNEPMPGYIGLRELTAAPGPLRIGYAPSPFESMLLGSGIACEVDEWRMTFLGARRIGRRLLNPSGVRAWLPEAGCIWLANGVWKVDESGSGVLLRPDHFCAVGGREVDFSQDYLKPFALALAKGIRSVHPQATIFLETEPRRSPPIWAGEDPSGFVYAPHWYDALTLLMKEMHPWLGVDSRSARLVIGPHAIRRSFADQLAALARDAGRLRGCPTLIGEFGVPFDLSKKRAYRTGDFRGQERALARNFDALDDNLLGGLLWNYTSDNDNLHGDQWNDEDLSVFSRDQQSTPDQVDSGGRALKGFVRPYAMAVAGEPVRMSFDRHRIFRLTFRGDPGVQAPTEIFVPEV
jgi:hypothetical protein